MSLPAQLAPFSRVHLIGIGGIGMSGLARYLRSQGLAVSGYDRTETPLTQTLAAEGMELWYRPHVARLQELAPQLVIYTPAIPAQQDELVWAREQGLPLHKRAEVLGWIASGYNGMAIAGTHGKTTTSSLLAHLLHATGMEPTAFVGGIMANYGSNFLLGSSDRIVVEADEFDRSFLHLHPRLAALTSIDPDHLDIYGTPEELRRTYAQFASGLQAGGTLALHHSLAGQLPLAPGIQVLSYGCSPHAQARISTPEIKGPVQRFDYTCGEWQLKGLELHMPGLHNAENACAALTLALLAGAPADKLPQALAKFQGIQRRFQIWLNGPRVAYIDDYAHHPAEIAAALAAARTHFPGYRLVVFFQPHLFTRTRDFAQGFAQALDAADEIYLLDIYPARELSIPQVSAYSIFQHLRTVNKHQITLGQISQVLDSTLLTPSVFMTLGAGDIDTSVSLFVQKLSKWA